MKQYCFKEPTRVQGAPASDNTDDSEACLYFKSVTNATHDGHFVNHQPSVPVPRDRDSRKVDPDCTAAGNCNVRVNTGDSERGRRENGS